MPAAEKDDGRLVRIELQAAPAAEEELSFAGVLSAFLARATGSLKEVATRGEATQVSVFPIAESLLASSQWPKIHNPLHRHGKFAAVSTLSWVFLLLML